MPETSALCFSTFSSVPRPKETTSNSSSSSSSYTYSTPSFPLCKFPHFNNLKLLHRSVRFVAKASSGSGNFLGDDAFGHFPWESSDSGDSSIQWVREEKVTLFTADGLIQIGGNLVPRRIASSDNIPGNVKTYQKAQHFQESHYMDPNQSLCLGALFDIAATNGLDTGRRLCIYGFCRSIEMLSDVVEDTVLEHGGEVNLLSLLLDLFPTPQTLSLSLLKPSALVSVSSGSSRGIYFYSFDTTPPDRSKFAFDWLYEKNVG